MRRNGCGGHVRNGDATFIQISRENVGQRTAEDFGRKSPVRPRFVTGAAEGLPGRRLAIIISGGTQVGTYRTTHKQTTTHKHSPQARPLTRPPPPPLRGEIRYAATTAMAWVRRGRRRYRFILSPLGTIDGRPPTGREHYHYYYIG